MNTYKFEHRGSSFTIVTEKNISHVYVIDQGFGSETVSRSSQGHPSWDLAYRAMKDQLRKLDKQMCPASGQVVPVEKVA